MDNRRLRGTVDGKPWSVHELLTQVLKDAQDAKNTKKKGEP
ncbi:hypothetical protein [Bradyrhizobium sp. Tv2a-2]|nr:hypothetical protein [Bradyrhizobium sp. Tv2a-2]